MGISKIYLLALLTILCFFPNPIIGQVIFKELPQYEYNLSDSTFWGSTQTRKIISLDGKWKVFTSGKREDESVEVNVPSVFQGNGDLTFEKYFYLSSEQINRHRLKISFLGLNYSADIIVNGVIIYRQTGGEFPFNVNLPKDILIPGKNNLLTVKLKYNLDSDNTIPAKQRFLFPHNFGGILRDVFIVESPVISINNLDISYNFIPANNKAKINVFARIENRDFNKDSLLNASDFSLKVRIVSLNGSDNENAPDFNFQLDLNKDKKINESFDLASPSVWSPNNPSRYLAYVELWRGSNLIDRKVRPMAFYSLNVGKESLTLNGNQFLLNGVTYIPSSSEYGNLASYSQMERDIKMIKDLGFNAVRFEKEIPHPYLLNLCEKYGLIAFVEIPINGVPGSISYEKKFESSAENYLINFLSAYKKYPAIAAVGLGSSYLPQSESTNTFISNLAKIVKEKSNFLTYASFTNSNILPVDKIDMYGLEFFNTPINKVDDAVKNAQKTFGVGKIFISELIYLVNSGNTDGYVNKFSFEAQAKYFQDFLDYTSNNPLSGYFISSMFDYNGDFASLCAGYSKDNVYKMGICAEDRSTDRLGYKVIYSMFHNADKVTIPIGNEKDRSPMIFILLGLILAIALGILVNSGRKFREDSSRALLRPYNFFADVRDMRIMSGPQTTFLGLIVAVVMALIGSNLLFYFRESIFLEKILLSFGSNGIISTVSYFAWHPFQSIIWLSIISLILLVLITLLVKLASFFVRNRVFLSSAYFTVIWSFLPVVLLIPVGIVLFRLLNADIANIWIYILLMSFILWVFYRLMKGIYVIFDINAASVYFYSLLILALLLGSVLLYFQERNSAINYIQLTFRQFNILG